MKIRLLLVQLFVLAAGALAEPAEPLRFVFTPHPTASVEGELYLTDSRDNPTRELTLEQSSISVSPGWIEKGGVAIAARHFVEGFGSVIVTADNEGRFYDGDEGTLNLNYELAESYLSRNQDSLKSSPDVPFSTRTTALHRQAGERLKQAQTTGSASLADESLSLSLDAGERIELEKARHTISIRPPRLRFQFGIESRHLTWAKSDALAELLGDTFNAAKITHYDFDTWYFPFQPVEGEYYFGMKDDILKRLRAEGIETVEGRPLFWFHPWVTPDWLAAKSFEQLKEYVPRHVRSVVGHYKGGIQQWEVFNEIHDWANVHRLTEQQITELVRLACQTCREVDPQAELLINVALPFGEYAARGVDASGPAPRRLRTPLQFLEDLVEAGVPFDAIGVQLYYPDRSHADIVRMLDRYRRLGKPLYISEVGAPSAPTEPDDDVPRWRERWSEELQARWAEEIYTICYSKPWIQGIYWYDFTDMRAFLPHGGLAHEDATPKEALLRLRALIESW